MAKLTKFTKVASGGRDKGDRTLNGFGALPITQKATVSGTPATTLSPTETMISNTIPGMGAMT